jgi:hypothetical protein
MMNTKLLLTISVLILTLLTGCANSGNNNGSRGGHHPHGVMLSDRCDGFSTGDMSRDMYCRQLEDRIIDSEIIDREIEREVIRREIDDALIDPDFGVDLYQ